MTPKVAGKPDTRTALLETGMDIMFVKGYSNTGIQEILSALGVPKGSFYHYFNSKEDFALEIIAHFEEGYTANLLAQLRDSSRTPKQRLRKYCDDGRDRLLSQQCSRGCLIGNLSQEMSDQSEVLRKSLSHVMEKWRDIFTACIEEAQAAGEISKEMPARQLSGLFLASWDGAVMRSKTQKTPEPMDTVIELMFNHVLKP